MNPSYIPALYRIFLRYIAILFHLVIKPVMLSHSVGNHRLKMELRFTTATRLMLFFTASRLTLRIAWPLTSRHRMVFHPAVKNTEFNPLNAKLNPVCHLLALLRAHHILHFSRIRIKLKISLT
jgi:hypothetical protein